MTWYLIAVLFTVGLWGLLKKRNLIKKIMALSIINSTVVILFIYMGSLTGTNAPILVEQTVDIVDPLPQALMLTAIVVGICITALAMVFIHIIYQSSGTLDIREIEKKVRDSNE